MNAWVQLAGSGGLMVVVAAVVNAIANRRRLGAETQNLSASATKAISDAAAGVVANLERDNDRLRTSETAAAQQRAKDHDRIDKLVDRVDELEELQQEWELERQEWMNVLQVHAAWDALAITAVQQAIPPIDLPLAPPLTSPTLRRKHRYGEPRDVG